MDVKSKPRDAASQSPEGKNATGSKVVRAVALGISVAAGAYTVVQGTRNVVDAWRNEIYKDAFYYGGVAMAFRLEDSGCRLPESLELDLYSSPKTKR